jgi:hypothetical protein
VAEGDDGTVRDKVLAVEPGASRSVGRLVVRPGDDPNIPGKRA